jgi:SH3-like domain-containing protein
LKSLLSVLLVLLAMPAWGLEYRSTARPAILYDAPTASGARLAVVGSKVPLEVVVDTGDWVRVRDVEGRLSWVEKGALGGGRSVMVRAEESTVRREPQPESEAVFRAARGVLLDAVGEPTSLGWLQVRHPGGLSGWLRIQEVWGL